MDTEVFEQSLDGSSSEPNSKVAQSMLSIVKNFIGFFVLSEEERAQAGIDDAGIPMDVEKKLG